MSSSLWVPPKTEEEMREKIRKEYRAVLWSLMDFEDSVCKRWNPELKKVDPYILLGRAKPMAYVPGYPVIPGFYHFLRDNPNAPPTCQPITQGDDEENPQFVEPDEGLLRKLKANDLLDPRVIVEHEAAQEKARRDEEKRKEDRRERRQAEILERWEAGNRAFVGWTPEGKWTQTVRGKKGK